MTKSMTSGNPLKLMIQFAFPLLLGNLLQQTYNIIDAAIVGQCLGAKALASVGASSSVQFLVLGFCMGSCAGFGVPIAKYYGANDSDRMRNSIFNGAFLTIVIAVILTTACSLLCPQILHILSVPEDIYQNAYAYLIIIFLGMPFTLLYNYLSSVLRSVGDSKTPFLFLAISVVLNIFLDAFCILVLKWGCAGAAIATITSQAVSGILCLLFILHRLDFLCLKKENRHLRFAPIKELLSMGLPMGLQFSITAIGSIMLQSANNALGTACVAAFTSAMRIKMFFICPFESLGIAMATYCGQNYGAGKPKRIWQGIKASGVMMLIYALLTFVVLMVGARTLALLFVDTTELEILKNTELFLHVSAYFFPFLGLLCILRYTIQGAGYTNLAMLSGVSEMIARTLVSIYAVPVYGYIAVCFGDPTAWLAADLFLIPAFIYVYRKLKELRCPLTEG